MGSIIAPKWKGSGIERRIQLPAVNEGNVNVHVHVHVLYVLLQICVYVLFVVRVEMSDGVKTRMTWMAVLWFLRWVLWSRVGMEWDDANRLFRFSLYGMLARSLACG